MTVEGSEGEGVGDPDVYRLQIDSLSTLSREPTHLAHGGNGGYQALNLAALTGAERIVLLGYDLKFKGGRQNWHADHKVKTPPRYVAQWIPAFGRIAAELARDGVQVFNASEETALACFPRVPIAELLPLPALEAAIRHD